MGTNFPDDNPEAGPIAERLDRIEARMSAIEKRSQISAMSEPHVSEVEALYAQVTEHRKRVAVEVAAVEKRFEMLAREIPAALESIVGPRVEDLRAHLRTEREQSVGATLAKFEQTVNTRLEERIATVERVVREQSATLNTLSRRAVESDANVQRLVAAVGRLCSIGVSGPSPLRKPSFVDLALTAQGNPDEKRKPAEAAQPIEFESGFHHHIVSEEESEPPKRHRTPIARS